MRKQQLFWSTLRDIGHTNRHLSGSVQILGLCGDRGDGERGHVRDRTGRAQVRFRHRRHASRARRGATRETGANAQASGATLRVCQCTGHDC